jgi:DNA polymerase-3 subunit gamma/tau
MSENYIVSARKYRPSNFKTVIGQEHISETLRNAVVSNHIAHAYLFTGPRGIGKTTCARILAKAINCENIGADGEPCNNCGSCNTFNEQRSLNIYELDAASNNSVDDIRALVDQVRFAPQTGKFKVYIIDEVHMLSANAFNAFLKTLEEPPPYAVFILATTEKNKIIPTILSRCQSFDFKRIQVKDIVEHLKYICRQEHIEFEEEALHIIALKADGALRDALTILDRLVSFSSNQIKYDFVIENLNIIDYEHFFKLIEYILSKDVAQTLLLLDMITQSGFDNINILTGLSEHFRNLLVARNANTIRLLDIPESFKLRYKEQAEKTQISVIMSALNILNQSTLTYKDSKNQRLHTELALLKLCYLKDAIQFSSDTASVDEKKNDLTEQKPSAKSIIPPDVKPKEEVQISVEPIHTDLKSLREAKEQDDTKKNTKNGNIPEPEKEGDEQLAEITDVVTQETFSIAWNEWVENLKKTNLNLHIGLKGQSPQVGENNMVDVFLSNDALVEMFNKEKAEIAVFLHSRHNISGISFNIIVKHHGSGDEKKYFTSPKEKFIAMKESNPEIENLIQKLDLKIE